FTRAACSRQVTSRGQRRQTTTARSSAVSESRPLTSSRAPAPRRLAGRSAGRARQRRCPARRTQRPPPAAADGAATAGGSPAEARVGLALAGPGPEVVLGEPPGSGLE